MEAGELSHLDLRLRRRVGGYREYDLTPGAGPPGRLWRYAAGGGEAVHRVLPTTAVSLCVEYRRDPAGKVRDPRPLFLGPVASIRFFAPPAGLGMEAVEVPPELCRDLLGIAPEEHVDAIESLEDVRPVLTGSLMRRMRRVAAPSALAVALLAWLRQRWAGTEVEAAASLAHVALSRLRAGPAGSRLDSTAAALGYSSRHLRRVIRATTGVSPKYVQRVARLDAAMAEADALRAPRWAQIAAGHGYCDQSHLIRDCRALALASPVELHEERRAEAPAD